MEIKTRTLALVYLLTIVVFLLIFRFPLIPKEKIENENLLTVQIRENIFKSLEEGELTINTCKRLLSLSEIPTGMVVHNQVYNLTTKIVDLGRNFTDEYTLSKSLQLVYRNESLIICGRIEAYVFKIFNPELLENIYNSKLAELTNCSIVGNFTCNNGNITVLMGKEGNVTLFLERVILFPDEEVPGNMKASEWFRINEPIVVVRVGRVIKKINDRAYFKLRVLPYMEHYCNPHLYHSYRIYDYEGAFPWQ